ncbi:hypothetical protein SAMN04487913_11254 [Arthrobacter sp. ok362]|nr:hypothetical protein SAMN04487913_11254 [Arthrobacter sp. ok362]
MIEVLCMIGEPMLARRPHRRIGQSVSVSTAPAKAKPAAIRPGTVREVLAAATPRAYPYEL